MAGWIDYAFGQNWVEQLKEGYRTTHSEHVREPLPERVEHHRHHLVDMCVFWEASSQGYDVWRNRDDHVYCDWDAYTNEPIFKLQR